MNMLFWISLFLITYLALFFSEIIKEKTSVILRMFIIIIYIIISAFRYNIGWDYEQYVVNYIMMSWQDFDLVLNTQIELIYFLLVNLLKALGFSAQMFFCVTSFIILFILDKANNNYFNTNKEKMIALIIFIFSPHLFMESLNIVRQTIAILIIYYSYKYYLDKDYMKYFAGVIVAFFWHTSALVGLLLPFVPRKKYSIYTYVMLFALFIIIYKMDVLFYAVSIVFEVLGIDDTIIKYAKYLNSSEQQLPVLMIGFDFVIFIYLIAFSSKIYGQYLNMLLICFGVFICFSYSHELMRIGNYFLVFYIIPFVDAIRKTKILTIRMFVLGMLMIYSLALIDGNIEQRNKLLNVPRSAYNYEYEFNFRIVD